MKTFFLIFLIVFLLWLLTRRSRTRKGHPILLFLILAYLFNQSRR
ncbi:hypothetical protein [Sporolactobacillus pectinivorans]|nr:hypothetical protein [Sporolactobacillus pectinivorans]